MHYREVRRADHVLTGRKYLRGVQCYLKRGVKIH